MDILATHHRTISQNPSSTPVTSAPKYSLPFLIQTLKKEKHKLVPNPRNASDANIKDVPIVLEHSP
jgi:hypothetical protein